MKPTTKDLRGDFPKPTDGWHGFEIGDRIAWAEKDGTATKQLLIPLDVVEGEEKGNGLLNGCGLDKKGGRKALALLLVYSRLAAKLEDKMDLDGKDLDEEAWGEKYLNPDTNIGTEVINNVILKLPGFKIDGKVKTNNKGYCNLLRLDEYGQGAKNDDSDDKGGKSESGPKPSADTAKPKSEKEW